jgi:hypothetical protein
MHFFSSSLFILLFLPFNFFFSFFVLLSALSSATHQQSWNKLSCIEYEDAIASSQFQSRTMDLGKECEALFTFPPKDVTVSVVPFYTIDLPVWEGMWWSR